jgi:hypothetical protein
LYWSLGSKYIEIFIFEEEKIFVSLTVYLNSLWTDNTDYRNPAWIMCRRPLAFKPDLRVEDINDLCNIGVPEVLVLSLKGGFNLMWIRKGNWGYPNNSQNLFFSKCII